VRAGAGRTGGSKNIHPTVKPVELMRWLVRLVAPVGGTVLDPFTGSGTTGMACRYELREFVGIEREAEYIAIAERRIAAVAPLFWEISA
jgi:site-specific DNA-methyltransferase (adenine-specific)